MLLNRFLMFSLFLVLVVGFASCGSAEKPIEDRIINKRTYLQVKNDCGSQPGCVTDVFYKAVQDYCFESNLTTKECGKLRDKVLGKVAEYSIEQATRALDEIHRLENRK